MGALVTILQAGQLIVSFIVPAIETALHIKSLFELNPDFTVNVTNLSGEALTADQSTIDTVNAWRKTVNLPPLTFPDSSAPAAPAASS